jgi:hypothetical protein
MGARSVSYQDSIATQNINTTGVTTSILDVDPEGGTRLKLVENADSIPGGPGLPIFAKFKDSNDNDLPTDTELVLRVDRPTDDEPITVAQKEFNIASWNQLSIKDQRNSEKIDSVKLELNGSAVNVRDKDTLSIEINGSTKIDWSNSELYIPRAAVRELPFEG